MSKSKDALASKGAFDYLNKQNRPYSAIDIFNNLHKEYGKTAIVKALESLAAAVKIREKLYGKQKVYVADQSQFAAVSDAELKGMDSSISDLTNSLRQSQETTKQNDARLRALTSSLTTQEANKQLVTLTEQCTTAANRLDNLKNQSNGVSPEERKQVMGSRSLYVKAWRKRKRMTTDIMNAVLEGYPKSKKQLCEEVGIETDEDFSVKPPEL